MSDGTIRIDTEIDTRKASSQLLQLQNTMTKTADRISNIKARMRDIQVSGALSLSAERLSEELAVCLERLSELQEEYARLDTSGTGTSEEFEAIADEADIIKARMKELNRMQVGQEKYSKLNQELKAASNQMAVMAKRQKEIAKAGTPVLDFFQKLGHRIAGLAKRIFIFSLIANAFRGMITSVKEGVDKMALYSGEFNRKISDFKGATATMKNAFVAMAEPIMSALLPALTTLVGWITTAINAINQLFAAISGRKTWTRAIKQQVDYAKSLKQTQKAAKDANGELAAFDDLIVLQKKDMQDAAGDGLVDPNTLFEEAPLDTSLFDKLKAAFKKLFDPFKRGFLDSLGDIEGRLNTLKGYVGRLRDALADIFADPKVRAAADAWVESFMYALGSITGAAASIGITIATNLTGGLTQYLEGNKDRIKDYLVEMFTLGTRGNEIVAQFAQVLADIARVFEGPNAIKVTENIIGIFAEMFMGVTRLALKFGLDLLDLITRPIIENKDAIKQALDGTLGVIAQVLGSIKEFVASTFDYINRAYDTKIRPIFERLSKRLSDVVGAIINAYTRHVLPILQEAASRFEEFLKRYWQPLTETVIDNVAKMAGVVEVFWQMVMDVIEWLARNVLPLVTPVVEGMVGLLFDLLEVFTSVVTGVHKGSGGIITAIKAVMEFLRDTVLPVVLAVLGTLIQNFSERATAIINGARGIITVLREVVDFVRNVFAGDWRSAWENVRNIFATVFSSLAGYIKLPLNNIIDMVNFALSAITRGLNAIIRALNRVSFDVPDWVPGFGGSHFGIDIPEIDGLRIPTLANGGITTGATLAQIGEAGQEAVLPLETNTGWMQDLADAIRDRGGEGRPVYLQVDGATFARLILPYMDAEDSRVGVRLSVARG